MVDISRFGSAFVRQIAACGNGSRSQGLTFTPNPGHKLFDLGNPGTDDGTPSPWASDLAEIANTLNTAFDDMARDLLAKVLEDNDHGQALQQYADRLHVTMVYDKDVARPYLALAIQTDAAYTSVDPAKLLAHTTA